MSETVALVETGPFFFRDVPHWHYNSKATVLLEDLVKYTIVLENVVDEIITLTVKNSGGIELKQGWGSTYGKEYGGVFASGSKTIDIVPTYGAGPIAVIPASNSYTELTAWLKKDKPQTGLAALNTVAKTLEVTYGSPTENLFGLKETVGKTYSFSISAQPSVVGGQLVTPVPGEPYTYEFTSENFVSLSDLATAANASEPFPVEVSDTDILDYVRNGDTVYGSIQVSIIDIFSSADVPVAGSEPRNVVYKVNDPDDSYFNSYMIVNEAGTGYEIEPDITFTGEILAAFTLREDPNNPGSMTDGTHVFMEPLGGWDNTFFDVGNSATFRIQAYFEKFYGALSGMKFTANSVSFFATSPANDSADLTIVPESLDIMRLLPVYTDDFTDLLAFVDIPSTVVTLNQEGREYVENYRTFFHEMVKSYTMPDNYVPDGPVVITDLTSTDLDPEGTCNTEFRVEGRNIVFNRANNLVANPSFYVVDATNSIPAWESMDAEIIRGENGFSTYLHEKSVALKISAKSYIKQHIAGINPEKMHCLSFYAKSLDSTVKATIYCYRDAPFVAAPYEEDANHVIEFSAEPVTLEWTRYVARVKNLQDLRETTETELQPASGIHEMFPADTTDILIKIEKPTGAEDLIIDCIQLEEGTSNPSEFSCSYDLAVVEYETRARKFAPRYMVSPTENSFNNGIAAITIDDSDINETGLPETCLTPFNREAVVETFKRRTWARTYGANKLVERSVFSSTRKKAKGSFFLYPDLPKPENISFLANPMITSMKTLDQKSDDDVFLLVVEDASAKNLSANSVNLSFGLKEDEFFMSKNVSTDGRGVACFKVPEIFMENACPIFTAGLSSGHDINMGNVITITGPNSFSYPDTIPSGTFYVRAFDQFGNYTPLYTVSAVSGSDITVGTTLTADYGSSIGLTSAFYAMLIPSVANVTPGYVKVTESLLYDCDEQNNGNAVVTYRSGIDNVEYLYRSYGRGLEDRTVSKTYTVTKTGDQIYATLPKNEFNAVRNTVRIINPDDPTKVYQQSFSNTPREGTFFMDYEARKLYLFDNRLSTITIEFLPSPFFVNPANKRALYVSSNVLLGIVKNIATGISTSELSSHHLNTGLTPAPGPINPFTFPLDLRVYFYAELYVKAQHLDIISSSSIVYRHNRPIL